MRIDQTTVPLLPRTTANCLDLGLRFLMAHLRPIAGIWLSAAVPAGVLTYLLAIQLEMDVRLTAVVLYFATMPLGVLLIAGTSRALFGETFVPVREASSRRARLGRQVLNFADGISLLLFGVLVVDYVAGRFAIKFLPDENDTLIISILGAILASLLLRLTLVVARYASFSPGLWKVLIAGFFRRLAIGIGPGLILFPYDSWMIALGLVTTIFSVFFLLRSGFLPETTFLQSIDRRLRSRATRELLKSEGGSLFFRGWWIVIYCGVISMVLFLTIDITLESLLGFPILLGRLRDIFPVSSIVQFPGARFFEIATIIIEFAMSDPKTLGVLTAVVMISYPIGRLAWFFCYIDLRVRKDLWDLEMQFQQEAHRLERRAE